MGRRIKISVILVFVSIFILVNTDSFARRVKEPVSLGGWLVGITKDVINNSSELSPRERLIELLNKTLTHLERHELKDLRLVRDGDYKLYYVFMVSDISAVSSTNFILNAETGELIQQCSFEGEIPQPLSMSGYELLKSFSSGGSGAKTYLAMKRSGDADSPDRLVVVKYADRYGVDGVGMPVLEYQAARLDYLQHVIDSEIKIMEDLTPEEVEELKNFFPEVIELSRNKGIYVYYSMPYRPGETLTEYFMKSEVSVGDFIAELNDLLTDISISLKARDNINLSLDEGIEHTSEWHIERIERRLQLMQQREGTMFEESIKDNPVAISNAKYENITYLFEELLASKTITVNGGEYSNIPVLIDEIKNRPDLLETIAPAFISRLSHGDLIIRNMFKEDSGHIRLIDVKGVDPEDEALDPLYGISKMVFGFGYDLVREGLYDLDVKRQENGSFSFDLKFDGSNPIVARYLEAIQLAKKMVEDNPEFNQVMQSDIHWEERLAFSITAHFIGDLACHLEPDKSGRSSLALYAIGTVLLDDYLRHLDIDLGLIFKADNQE